MSETTEAGAGIVAPVAKSFAQRASPEMLLLALVLAWSCYVQQKFADAVVALSSEIKASRAATDELLAHVDRWR